MQKISLIPTILLIAVWIDFVFLSFVIKQEHYTYLNLLPLALGVFLLFDFDWFERAKKYQGYMIFLCTLFIRYAIAPTVLYLADFKVSMGSPLSSLPISNAIFLQVYELFAISIVLQIYAKRKYSINSSSILPNVKEELEFFTKKHMFIAILFLGGFLLIAVPSLRNEVNFIFSKTSIFDNSATSIPMYGSLALIVKYSKILLPLILIDYLAKQYCNNQSNKYIIYSIIVVAISMMFTKEISRLNMLFPAIAFWAVLNRAYENKRIIISKWMFTLLTILLLSLTIYKSFTRFEISVSATPLSYYATMLQQYFSGTQNVAITLSLNNLSSIDSQLLPLKDCFANIPIIGETFVNRSDLSNVIFNHKYWGTSLIQDQIIPVIGQGYLYAGKLFSIIPSCLFFILLVHFDSRQKIIPQLDLVFIDAYVTASLACFLMTNITIISSGLFSMYFLLKIICKLNKKVSFW
jgi:hypothetical protein